MSRKKAAPAGSGNFRKPPVEYQFKKGKSGNLAGRPPKKPTPIEGVGGGIVDRLNSMALEEATRPVTVHEGDRVSKMPAMQALLRTMFRAAAKGDTKAARQLTELIARAEAGRAATALEKLRHAAQYKDKYLSIIERYERAGLDPPEIYPHPDDLLINGATGEVEIDGPASKEQAGAQQIVRAKFVETMRRYLEVEQAIKKDPANRALKREMKELKLHWDFFQSDFERTRRHEANRMMRRAFDKDATQDDDDSSDEKS